MPLTLPAQPVPTDLDDPFKYMDTDHISAPYEEATTLPELLRKPTPTREEAMLYLAIQELCQPGARAVEFAGKNPEYIYEELRRRSLAKVTF